MHDSLFSGICKIGYDDHLEVVRYPTLQLFLDTKPFSWRAELSKKKRSKSKKKKSKSKKKKEKRSKSKKNGQIKKKKKIIQRLKKKKKKVRVLFSTEACMNYSVYEIYLTFGPRLEKGCRPMV